VCISAHVNCNNHLHICLVREVGLSNPHKLYGLLSFSVKQSLSINGIEGNFRVRGKFFLLEYPEGEKTSSGINFSINLKSHKINFLKMISVLNWMLIWMHIRFMPFSIKNYFFRRNFLEHEASNKTDEDEKKNNFPNVLFLS